MPRVFTALSILVLAGSAASAQDVERFRLRVGANLVSGTERFSITQTGAGYELTATTTLARGPAEGSFTLRETFAPDWTTETYSLEMTGTLGAASVKGERTGDALAFTVTVSGATPTRELPLKPRMVLMDNMVAAPYQVLLNLTGGRPGPLTIVVPLHLTAVEGLLSAADAAAGTLDGTPVATSRWHLTVAGTEMEVYAEAATHRFLRLVVPSQDFELVHEGFVMAETRQEPAAVARPPGVTEREVHFASADGQPFAATLCLPSILPAPLVVLMQGSGPQDRDETIGPNKPFRDLAWGLAERGVATLRYDKRTYAFPKSYQGTLDSESIDDAAAAVRFAAGLPEVDRGGVFVLGHSLGGLAAPYVAQKAAVRGLVLAAAPGRPMDRVIRDQVATLNASQGPEQLARTLALQDEIMAKVRAGTATVQDLQGQPPGAIRDMIVRDPIAELRRTTVPLLVIKGGKDAQVFQADYDALAGLAAARPGSEARLFPNLTHIFTAAEGTADFKAIFQPGHVAPEAIDLVAGWVRQTAGRR